MKKNVIFTLLVGLMLMSCAVQKKAIVEKPAMPEPQQVEAKDLVPWTQDMDYGITVGDPIVLYNEFQIFVKADIIIPIKMLKDGMYYEADSIIHLDFSIPARDSSRIVKVDVVDGKPVTIKTEFKRGEENYAQVFISQTDKTFTLKATKIYSVEGKDYTIKSIIDGDGSGKCRLMIRKGKLDNSERTIGGPAPGVQSTEGTKIIKTKK